MAMDIARNSNIPSIIRFHPSKEYYPPMPNQPAQNSEAIDPCPRCGARVPRVFVHGHYQCQSCRSNIDDCCGGGALLREFTDVANQKF